jgi:hypothetical protein
MSNVQQYNPFFEVVREPMFAEFNGKKIRTSKDALINPELGLIVGEVGKNYKLVENNEVAEVFNEAFADIKTESVIDHLNGTTGKWARQIILNDDNYVFSINGEDHCKVMIEIFNGYTGQKSVGFNIKAFRLICKNGLMGWKNELSVSIPHIRDGIINQIRGEFEDKLETFWNKTKVWEDWSQEEFGKDEFNLFIDTRKKLSDKMKENLKGYYDPIMNRFNEDETRWGAYNVLTAIASHHTKAKSGSHLFSNAHKRIESLINDFQSFDVNEARKQVNTELVVA